MFISHHLFFSLSLFLQHGQIQCPHIPAPLPILAVQKSSQCFLPLHCTPAGKSSAFCNINRLFLKIKGEAETLLLPVLTIILPFYITCEKLNSLLSWTQIDNKARPRLEKRRNQMEDLPFVTADFLPASKYPRPRSQKICITLVLLWLVWEECMYVGL